MKVKVNGKVWDFIRVRLKDKDHHGDCDSPNIPNKKIRVDSRLTGRQELEIIIHELLHAGCWVLSEEHVHQTAEDIARILWRLGYRKDGLTN